MPKRSGLKRGEYCLHVGKLSINPKKLKNVLIRTAKGDKYRPRVMGVVTLRTGTAAIPKPYVYAKGPHGPLRLTTL